MQSTADMAGVEDTDGKTGVAGLEKMDSEKDEESSDDYMYTSDESIEIDDFEPPALLLDIKALLNALEEKQEEEGGSVTKGTLRLRTQEGKEMEYSYEDVGQLEELLWQQILVAKRPDEPWYLGRSKNCHLLSCVT